MPVHDSVVDARGQRIDDWLADGARIKRTLGAIAARHLQPALGIKSLTAWPTPRSIEWKAFVRELWDQHFADGPVDDIESLARIRGPGGGSSTGSGFGGGGFGEVVQAEAGD